MIPDRLQPVLAAKTEHVQIKKLKSPFRQVESRARDTLPARGFATALRQRVEQGQYALIAEIKKASPSKGLIRADFDPAALARAYEAGGATCLSVLTDTPFFQGDDRHLALARDACSLPVLRKDFMIDPYQIAESRMLGADCVLLIMAAVDDGMAEEIMQAAAYWKMDVLVEVHNKDELDRALPLKPVLMGINNRNLKTLEIDLATSLELAAYLPPDSIAVGESGLSRPEDLARLHAAGISAFLIGESLLRQQDVAKAAETLLLTVNRN